jgi:polysaccharide pyruvyl transferase WcaK-like protein
MTKHTPTTISFFGNFGTTNFGNEATLDAMLSRLRLLFPGCEFCCICTGPENVVATHGIAAVPHTIRSARIWDRQLPLSKRLRMATLGLSEELREYARAWRTLGGSDLLIVPGTGLLTDAFGLSGWGPYGLLKWALVARLRRCDVMFVSVGAGPLRSASGRRVVRWALSLAAYRSYRDVPSRALVEATGLRVEDDPIYPDLVFGLSPPAKAAVREGRPVVGLGLMEYSEAYSTASPLRDTYERYVKSLVGVVDWLLDHDYDVKLLLGDRDADTFVVDDLKATLRERLATAGDGRVTYHPIDSVDDLVSQLSATDLVIATRFHNVLMSLLLRKPVVAISFHHKCSSLMGDMGLSDYCQDINTIDAEALIAKFEGLAEHSNDVERTIAQRLEGARSALDEQYEALFDEPLDGSLAARAAATSA